MGKENCVVRIYANVNPLEPNCLEIVDVSTKHCCSLQQYLDEVVPKQVNTLRSKGFRVKVQKSTLVFLDY